MEAFGWGMEPEHGHVGRKQAVGIALNLAGAVANPEIVRAKVVRLVVIHLAGQRRLIFKKKTFFHT